MKQLERFKPLGLKILVTHIHWKCIQGWSWTIHRLIIWRYVYLERCLYTKTETTLYIQANVWLFTEWDLSDWFCKSPNMTKTFYTTYGYYRGNVILLRHQLWSCQSCTREYTHAQFKQFCTSCRKRRHVLCLTQKFVTILFIETIIPDWLHQEVYKWTEQISWSFLCTSIV